jgi:hypothetical protein
MADFRKPYRTPPHKADFWESRLKSDIDELAGRKQKHLRFDAEYSKRLGIICHFYADFFCFVHTAAFNGTSFQHIKYELDLYRFMRKSFAKICGVDFDDDISACWDTGTIFGHYETLQKSYLKKAQSFENDVVYTLRACLCAVTMVTRASAQETAVCHPGHNVPAAASFPSL